MIFEGLYIADRCIIAVFKENKEQVLFDVDGLEWLITQQRDDIEEIKIGLSAVLATNINFK